ncbi:MAG: hypothetical protein AVDCRST_MAG88-643, partial [uncultured Thermomicrobiales bacterium]
AARGRVPMIIFDTPMLAADSYNYTRGFAGWDFVRGQHADRYVVDPIPTRLPAAPHKLKNVAATHRYLRNTAFRRSEDDWMAAQTLRRAMAWLERNRAREDFVLWVDLWDPHEPFDAPDFDLTRYADPDYRGEEIIYPRYGRPDYMDEAERDHVRAHYAALVTLVDRWIGRLLEKLEALGLARNTLVLFFSDHGHLFGDHDLQGKPTGPLGKLYEVTTRVPLLIRHPGGVGAGRRVGGIAQHPDLLPTILDVLGLPIPATVQGQSLWPLIRGEAEDVRECAVSGRYSRLASEGGRAPAGSDAAAFDGAAGIATAQEPLTLTTRRWAYLSPAEGGGDRELYDLDADPAQGRNLIAERPDVAAELHAALVAWLEGVGMPPGRVARYRRGERSAARDPLLPADTPLWAIEDGRGHTLAFTHRGAAEACLGPAVPPQAARETTLGRLREQVPRALVDMHDQYYRSEDLL